VNRKRVIEEIGRGRMESKEIEVRKAETIKIEKMMMWINQGKEGLLERGQNLIVGKNKDILQKKEER
jgi:hypothetical protein